MDDLKELFTKFQSNRLKHKKIYEFTLEKYEQVDDTEECDFDEDFEDEHGNLDENFGTSDEEEEENDDKNDHQLEKRYISNYCSVIKEQITSTPLLSEVLPPRPTLLSGISPFVSNRKQEKIRPRPNNILTTVLEKNHLNKISSLATPRIDDKNKSVILCQPRDKENLDPIEENDDGPVPQKLDFDFDVSDEEENDKVPEMGKIIPDKLPNFFQSTPNPFGGGSQARNNLNLDISNLSMPSPNDKYKDICAKFSTQPSQEPQVIKDTQEIEKLQVSIASPNDKFRMICENFVIKNTQPSQEKKRDKSPTIPIINKIRISSSQPNPSSKASELVEKMCRQFSGSSKNIEKISIVEPVEQLEKSLTKLSEANNISKSVTEQLEESEDDDDENDLLPVLAKKFVNNKKPINFTQSTPNPSAVNKIPYENLDISNLTICENGQKMDVSDSVNMTGNRTPLTAQKSKSRDKSAKNQDKKLFEIFNQSKSSKKLSQTNEIEIIDTVETVNQENLPKENEKIDESKEKENEFKKPLDKKNEKKGEKRFYLNLSNVTLDSSRPDFKKICLDKFQQQNNSNQNSVNMDTSRKKIVMNQSNLSMNPQRPDFQKICQEKFRKIDDSNTKNTIQSQKVSQNKPKGDPFKEMLNKAPTNTVISRFKT